MEQQETPHIFNSNNQQLLGIAHTPAELFTDVGVVIVVGGPQYRVGSHRQFILLARSLAAYGIPVFRFDYHGMGDSDGAKSDFNEVQHDIRSAIDEFQQHTPAIKRVALWGLCDAASASLFYGYSDERVCGMVLLNPWVRTEEGEAKAYLKHYYLQRMFSKEFLLKVLSGKFNPFSSLSSLFGFISKAKKSNRSQSEVVTAVESPCHGGLREKMLCGFQRFSGKGLVILSGDDLTSQEFQDMVKSSKDWQALMAEKRVTVKHLHEANHTFSRQEWRAQVEDWTRDWVKAL
ncbi:MAG: hydrolase 1, exosortase A system-associated [Gammaproteobacteria bacterium]|nr:hydrolase 1, exosortase A system-associated [Gammaproteobacteria bacterium]MDH5694618.1 hydrolase 1, exosortase A system-associated [Gammaproteobacteria bacterium]